MAVVATLAQVDIAADELERIVGFEPRHRLRRRTLENSGTISTRPPTATTRMINTIISRLLVSMRSCPLGLASAVWSCDM
jgi:hypothetical protein